MHDGISENDKLNSAPRKPCVFPILPKPSFLHQFRTTFRFKVSVVFDSTPEEMRFFMFAACVGILAPRALALPGASPNEARALGELFLPIVLIFS
jgi:hypothetical protein